MDTKDYLKVEDITLMDLIILNSAFRYSIPFVVSSERTKTLISAVDKFLHDESVSSYDKLILSELKEHLLIL